jgi:hypothetical protein
VTGEAAVKYRPAAAAAATAAAAAMAQADAAAMYTACRRSSKLIMCVIRIYLQDTAAAAAAAAAAAVLARQILLCVPLSNALCQLYCTAQEHQRTPLHALLLSGFKRFSSVQGGEALCSEAADCGG